MEPHLLSETNKNPEIVRTEKKKTAKNVKLYIKIAVIVFVCLIFVAAMALFEKNISPDMLHLAENAAAMKIGSDIDSAVLSLSKSGLISYENIVNAHYDKNGKIAFLTLDAEKSNALKGMLTSAISKKLSDGEKISISIPQGSLSGLNLFSGKGMKIKVTMYPVSSAVTDIQSEFVSCGINGIMHNVFIEVKCNVVIVLPGKSYSDTLTQKVILAQNIIMGDVPLSK